MSSSTYRSALLAVVGGHVYAILVLYWAESTGIHLTAMGSAMLASFLYAAGGLFLLAAIPLYLLGRYALVSPAAVTVLSLGLAAWKRWFEARPHDALGSYLFVWPVFLALVVLAAAVEAAIRYILDGWFGRYGPRPLL